MGKPLDECSREELVEIIKSQKETIARTKKLGLVWEDKPEKVITDCAKKLPVIKEVAEKAINKAGDSEPTNIIIEGDNYHALSVLNYTHAGKIDVVYIDPPYNTGARDWKYNNDYVDSNDFFRHSKWISMMEHRLRLAKNLLNPEESVLIVTIDEKEFDHLGVLLRQLFPDANIQMVSDMTNVKGVARENEFSRVNEYIYFVRIGKASVEAMSLSEEWLGNVRNSGRDKLRLGSMLRSGSNSERSHSPGCFYPIYFNKDGEFVMTGKPIPLDKSRFEVPTPEGLIAVWPIHKNGSEGVWQYSEPGFNKLLKDGFVYFGKLKGDKVGISYAPKGVQKKIKEGIFKIKGYSESGTAIIDDSDYNPTYIPGNQWSIPSHNSTEYGSKMIQDIFQDKRFTYPKSLYSTKDAIRFFVNKKKDATILDFFAGSGTTLHAINLMNAEDGGHRKVILSTNNEISEAEAKELRAKGYKPGDEEWEKLGIARYVTYPRTKYTIEGINANGEPLKGYYYGSSIKMSDGFNANVRYFKTEFIDKNDTMDKLRRELSPACEDMIRVREGAYEKIIDDEMLKVFKNSRGLTAIIYDRFELAEYIQKIEALDTDAPVHLYVFSYSKSNRKDEMPDNLKHKYEAQPIPEGVLEIYKKIFANIKGGKNA